MLKIVNDKNLRHHKRFYLTEHQIKYAGGFSTSVKGFRSDRLLDDEKLHSNIRPETPTCRSSDATKHKKEGTGTG